MLLAHNENLLVWDSGTVLSSSPDVWSLTACQRTNKLSSGQFLQNEISN